MALPRILGTMTGLKFGGAATGAGSTGQGPGGDGGGFNTPPDAGGTGGSSEHNRLIQRIGQQLQSGRQGSCHAGRCDGHRSRDASRAEPGLRPGRGSCRQADREQHRPGSSGSGPSRSGRNKQTGGHRTGGRGASWRRHGSARRWRCDGDGVPASARRSPGSGELRKLTGARRAWCEPKQSRSQASRELRRIRLQQAQRRERECSRHRKIRRVPEPANQFRQARKVLLRQDPI